MILIFGGAGGRGGGASGVVSRFDGPYENISPQMGDPYNHCLSLPSQCCPTPSMSESFVSSDHVAVCGV